MQPLPLRRSPNVELAFRSVGTGLGTGGGRYRCGHVSITTVIVAVLVPAVQRKRSLQDAREQRATEDKEHLKRLCAGLRAEIDAACEAADARHGTILQLLEGIKSALKTGAKLVSGGPIHPGSMNLTDAVIYREVAAELGRLPPELIASVVKFYNRAAEFGRIADGSSSTLSACENVLSLIPRLKMDAGLLLLSLKKFEAAAFSTKANLRPQPEEIYGVADQVGYPIEQIAKERGIQLPPRM